MNMFFWHSQLFIITAYHGSAILSYKNVRNNPHFILVVNVFPILPFDLLAPWR